MMNDENRKTLENKLEEASTTESDSRARECLVYCQGMLGYALVSNDITPSEHSAHWTMINLITEQRDLMKEMAQ